ncbi:MAG: prolyl oligopeptidase family serine peptidase, partial [Hyphomicrobiales bacterium]|nr:prolyl oligopeptidase family serine peptidase [Hyphomicrobiales bacterium]
MLRPQGKGPFPAIIALHGCGGLWQRDGTLTARHADWGERLRTWGYVVLFPSSYGSRGYTNLCKKKNRPVKYSHRIEDLRAAADWLAAQPFVDPGKIAVFGWSGGGSTLLRALAPDKAPRKAKFRAAIALYPGCKTIL